MGVKSYVTGLALATALAGANPSLAQIAPQRDLSVEMPNMGAGPRPTRPLRGPLNVSLVPTTSILRVGMPIAVRLMSTGSGFGHLYLLDASGKTQLLMENVPMRANRAMTYPPRNLVLRATPPAGDETVIFAVTRDPISGLAGRGTTRTPLQLQQTHSGLRAVLGQIFDAVSRDSYAFTEVSLRVE